MTTLQAVYIRTNIQYLQSKILKIAINHIKAKCNAKKEIKPKMDDDAHAGNILKGNVPTTTSTKTMYE